MSASQKDMLDSVLGRLSNEDTVVSVWMNEYERSKKEIIALLPTKSSLKSTIEWMFEDFDEKVADYWPEKRVELLEWIWDEIIKDSKKNKWDESYITPHFCNIFEHFNISAYTDRCWTASDTISSNYDTAKNEQTTTSEKSKFPLRLKIILIVLVWWLLTMWWIIVFFSIKARLNTESENEDEEW